jgi:hypothetical protein
MPITISGVSNDRAGLASAEYTFFCARGGGLSKSAPKFICRKIIFLSGNIAIDSSLKKGSVGI